LIVNVGIEKIMSLKEAMEKAKMLHKSLKGRPNSQVEYYLRKRVDSEDIELTARC
jgi:hypothetical protein